MLVQLLATLYGGAFVWVGLAHFVKPHIFVEIVPPYLPFGLFLVYLTGVMEVIGGLGVIFPQTRMVAGRFLALFLIVVYLANLHMWMNNVPFNGVTMTSFQHGARLLVQVLLIVAALSFSGDLS